MSKIWKRMLQIVIIECTVYFLLFVLVRDKTKYSVTTIQVFLSKPLCIFNLWGKHSPFSQKCWLVKCMIIYLRQLNQNGIFISWLFVMLFGTVFKFSIDDEITHKILFNTTLLHQPNLLLIKSRVPKHGNF